MTIPEDLITVDEAATVFGRHQQSVYRAIRLRRWPAYRRGARVLLSRAEIESLLAPQPYEGDDNA